MMTRRIMCGLFALGLVWTSPAMAKDDVACEPGLICASNPTTVAAAMMKAGYQALISKDSVGDPMIESAAAGYTFTIYFYGCDANKACDSIQFYTSFKNDEGRDAAFANRWNAEKRFMQMSIGKKGMIETRYDVATIGGLNAKNFRDVMDWWSAMLGDLGKFLDANPAAGAKPAVVAPPALDKKS